MQSGTLLDMLLHHSFRLQPRTLFGSRLVVCYRLASHRSHGTPDWIVLRPVFPSTRHWKGLTSIVVAVLYVSLTTVQHSRLVLPPTASGGSTSMPWVQYAPKLTPYSHYWCPVYKLCALQARFTCMGILDSRITLPLHWQQADCSAALQPAH